ncbi:MAG: thioredoxin family protein, partial [Bacteroidales bacterium]|nr:thioredoxin family protein [Bacteroidales bacterium]
AGISSKDYLVNEQQKYEAYSANQAQVDELKTIFKKNKKLNVVVVFATWCGDSKAHVPEFFKVADLAKIKKVKYLAVNRKKNAGTIDMSAMAIQRVPTFIVYNGLDEIGRITESPTETIEADLLAIVKKK